MGREGVGGSDRKMEDQVWCGVVSSCAAVRNNTANGGILALFFQCVCVCVCGCVWCVEEVVDGVEANIEKFETIQTWLILDTTCSAMGSENTTPEHIKTI